MVADYTLVESCAGSAALTFFLLGARRALVPYQGNKWRVRKELARCVQRLGFEGPPARVLLTDPGPWGRVLDAVLHLESREEVIEMLQYYAREDPRAIYDGLHGSPPSEEDTYFSAEFLFLQRLAFSGKAVGVRDGKWASPGFNRTSAYGKAATEKFSKINPMVPSMIATLESYNNDLVPCEVEVRQECAGARPLHVSGPTVEYLDPPYRGLTGYPNGSMTRQEVQDLAVRRRNEGAAVIVSEQEDIGLGWERSCIHGGRRDSSPFRGQQEEWVSLGRAH